MSSPSTSSMLTEPEPVSTTVVPTTSSTRTLPEPVSMLSSPRIDTASTAPLPVSMERSTLNAFGPGTARGHEDPRAPAPGGPRSEGRRTPPTRSPNPESGSGLRASDPLSPEGAVRPDPLGRCSSRGPCPGRRSGPPDRGPEAPCVPGCRRPRSPADRRPTHRAEPPPRPGNPTRARPRPHQPGCRPPHDGPSSWKVSACWASTGETLSPIPQRQRPRAPAPPSFEGVHRSLPVDPTQRMRMEPLTVSSSRLGPPLPRRPRALVRDTRPSSWKGTSVWRPPFTPTWRSGWR